MHFSIVDYKTRQHTVKSDTIGSPSNRKYIICSFICSPLLLLLLYLLRGVSRWFSVINVCVYKFLNCSTLPQSCLANWPISIALCHLLVPQLAALRRLAVFCIVLHWCHLHPPSLSLCGNAVNNLFQLHCFKWLYAKERVSWRALQPSSLGELDKPLGGSSSDAQTAFFNLFQI